RVDFPQPDGPMSATNSPRSTSRVRTPRAATGPAVDENTMETSRHAMSTMATLDLGRLRREHDLVRHDLVGRHLARDLVERLGGGGERRPDLRIHVAPALLQRRGRRDVRNAHLPRRHFHLAIEAAR